MWTVAIAMDTSATFWTAIFFLSLIGGVPEFIADGDAPTAFWVPRSGDRHLARSLESAPAVATVGNILANLMAATGVIASAPDLSTSPGLSIVPPQTSPLHLISPPCQISSHHQDVSQLLLGKNCLDLKICLSPSLLASPGDIFQFLGARVD
jgi:hypothetical protein